MSHYARNIRAAMAYDGCRRRQKQVGEAAELARKASQEAKNATRQEALHLLGLTLGMPAAVRVNSNTFRGFLSDVRIQVYPPAEGERLETVAVYAEVASGKRTYSGALESPGLTHDAQANLQAYLELRADPDRPK